MSQENNLQPEISPPLLIQHLHGDQRHCRQRPQKQRSAYTNNRTHSLSAH
jgi:hypothetical protein